MKKMIFVLVAVLALGFSSISFAGNEMDFIGTISAIDSSTKQITVVNPQKESVLFVVTPATKMEWEDRVIDHVKFNELKVGMWVNVEHIPSQTQPVTATEIDVFDVK